MKKSSLFIISIMTISLMASLGVAQEKIRSVEAATVRKNDPIIIIDSRVGHKVLNPANQVVADKNWLRDLRLSVKNISNKTIVYIKIELLIDKQGKQEYATRLPILFGTLPIRSLGYTDDDIAKAKVLKPNETTELQIPSGIADSSAQMFSDREVDVDHIKLIYDFVVFDDGTAWRQGDMMRQNPNDDKKWDLIKDGSNGGGLSKLIRRWFESNTTIALINSWGENTSFSWLNKNGFFLRTI